MPTDNPTGRAAAALAWFEGVRERFGSWQVVAEPDRDEAEWWAGAPSVARDAQGAFWLACRMRTANDRLGRRGYEIRIFRSEEGAAWAHVHSIRREDVPIAGFERPALLFDPATDRFSLYGCGPVDDVWCIVRFDDADRPDRFVPNSCRTVISPPGGDAPTGYKDPFVWLEGDRKRLVTIGILGKEQAFAFESGDGEAWQPLGDPAASLLPLSGWHNEAVRPACALPAFGGHLLVYEGSDAAWHDPCYNIATGLAWTADLRTVTDLTPDAPVLRSPTPGRLHAWRYSHWLTVGEETWVFAEVSKSNSAHETRLFRLPAPPP
ncbi:MAG: hypothetical protein NT029_16645 [Armatimonadetes bacterium]|nr:hypothetical protein [Armatimonadota bacterium]